MMAKKRVKDDVWKLSFDSNTYFLDLEKKILIDTGDYRYKEEIVDSLKGLVDPDDIDIVILTHFHYDHSGNAELFKNARFYSSKEAYDDFISNPFGAVLNEKVAGILKRIDFSFLEEGQDFFGLKVIKTPGHTNGSICLFFEKEKILFSGDTLFDRGNIGRCDLPTSVPEKYDKTLKKLDKIDYEILCPGHDY